jgi:hypothetical protein
LRASDSWVTDLDVPAMFRRCSGSRTVSSHGISATTIMTDLSDSAAGACSLAGRKQQLRQRTGLILLLCFHIVICCVSFRLAYPDYRDFHILYDESRLPYAVAAVTAFALISPLFAFARFSFGYFVGFYFYTMILGYLWLNCFSKFQYNHTAAGISAAISAVAFLLPALVITSPIKRLYVLPEPAFERLLALIVLFCAATAVVGATYNFRFVTIDNIYEFREQLQNPAWLNYATAATTSVLLPYAFACYLSLKKSWRAAAVLLIALSFYPITLSKLTLFTPAWLVVLAVLSRISEVRVTTILSFLVPVIVGLILIRAVGEPTRTYFSIINMRLLMVPSNALDIYNEYFARHELTYFCQIWILKPFVSCALEHPLSIEMQNNYALGNLNASLFATEGVASVGLLFAPVSVFVCGLVVALGNRLSAELPPRFILISSAVLPQLLLNIPFTTVFLTHGLWILFLLWYVMPRTMFEKE